MKIEIFGEKIKLIFILPDFLIKSRFVMKDISNGDRKKAKKIRKRMYKALKTYKRKNGHFTFCDATFDQGRRLKITF